MQFTLAVPWHLICRNKMLSAKYWQAQRITIAFLEHIIFVHLEYFSSFLYCVSNLQDLGDGSHKHLLFLESKSPVTAILLGLRTQFDNFPVWHISQSLCRVHSTLLLGAGATWHIFLLSARVQGIVIGVYTFSVNADNPLTQFASLIHTLHSHIITRHTPK